MKHAMKCDFTGQVCVITGASRGIGWRLAADFAAEGAMVFGAGRNAKALEGLRAEIQGAGGRFVPVQVDLSKVAECRKLIERALGEGGRIDVLVNNLGITGAHKSVRDLEPAEWQEAIDTNLTSVYACAHYAVGSMMERRAGAIVNVSSTATKIRSPFRAGYVASKMGLIGLTRVLAQELGPYGIRVNAVSPGFVDGERSDEAQELMARNEGVSREDVRRRILSASPLNRSVPPEDISSMVRYLASDLGRSMTGQDIEVAAGM
jgi:NAD(P)-dependent dehydrogenase (short-subunit alcohol dehydrogenase family)